MAVVDANWALVVAMLCKIEPGNGAQIDAAIKAQQNCYKITMKCVEDSQQRLTHKAVDDCSTTFSDLMKK